MNTPSASSVLLRSFHHHSPQGYSYYFVRSVGLPRALATINSAATTRTATTKTTTTRITHPPQHGGCSLRRPELQWTTSASSTTIDLKKALFSTAVVAPDTITDQREEEIGEPLEQQSQKQSSPNSSTQASLSRARKKKTLQDMDSKRDPIMLTDRAAERIQELLSNQSQALGIRLGVKRRGCNGLSYTLNYVTQGAQPTKDIHMTSPQGVQIWIEPMALFNVVGTQMDWEETELTSEFTFHNPNSKGQCGCGESFNV